ncbi:putative fungal zn binuclear cluster domain containing protein [Eutypa lata UCREL1]|uniref:Putative fungal zn binuclear cluster domain containing protein n=1 Tax=Eutypa lata (strain UCR-EL1) TaxID=1287681 RepID=M7T2W8_EUTLA|nr:putative fungal zn binuclear cluster domain containing protein [Eutypa lata UCREL1]
MMIPVTCPIRKVMKGGKIEKKKVESPGKFVIMTPNLINAQSGKPNPFECFEAMRTTQRGRKGPLANETKESALQVRRLGACFCCHSRKVKCDKERPCKNCKKLTAQVPQIICWQFQDFLPVLFPDFIRGHFKKEAISGFITDNVQHFRVAGEEQLCSVELFSGFQFQSTLTVPATFFTAKTAEILQHWHLNTGVNQIDLQSRGSAPIGINPENNTQREELKKRAREYIHNLTFEPLYADQVTDAIRSTMLPRKVLKIVQRFGQRSNSPMVKRALSIYVTHYVLTRQLCLTPGTISRLQHTNLVPQNTNFVTTRVLNRQVKSMLDELLLKEMQGLFDSFSRSLKPKSRKEWAPCAAAFLVLCLFMEAVETAADTFVISQNEISIRNRSKPEYKREFALSLCKEIDNLPFKQFAYQFHQIYQTHSKDAATKAFNPLVDETLIQQGELDNAAIEMVVALKELLEGDNWHELDFLVADPILPNGETHPYPRDVSLNYTGRLLARFLLSFTDEKYLFDGQY